MSISIIELTGNNGEDDNAIYGMGDASEMGNSTARGMANEMSCLRIDVRQNELLVDEGEAGELVSPRVHFQHFRVNRS